ncbi:unnamed protein product [Staurois parvus]|uniref:Uncharacterized protein n=1 Tax=Staurois parvus TaxID=386267 RepID=A0ABN9CQ09_9NEOB|nr:unnamed protein product [Staurois parvus]
MQLPVLGCTFLTLSRALMISALMIVPSSATHQFRRPVPKSAPT